MIDPNEAAFKKLNNIVSFQEETIENLQGEIERLDEIILDLSTAQESAESEYDDNIWSLERDHESEVDGLEMQISDLDGEIDLLNTDLSDALDNACSCNG